MTEEKNRVAVALLCDDVRVEATGKDLLIGVYQGGLVLYFRPAIVQAVAWVSLKIVRSGDVRFRIRLPSHQRETVLPGHVEYRGEHHFLRICLQLSLVISQPDVLILEFAADEDDWREAERWDITFDDPSEVDMPLPLLEAATQVPLAQHKTLPGMSSEAIRAAAVPSPPTAAAKESAS